MPIKTETPLFPGTFFAAAAPCGWKAVTPYPIVFEIQRHKGEAKHEADETEK
jgi:hypothetical protein